MNPHDIASHLEICLPRLSGHLDPQARIAELALDSMDTVELLCSIHSEFGVRFTESEFHPAQTVGGLIDLIVARRIANGSAADRGKAPSASLPARPSRQQSASDTLRS